MNSKLVDQTYLPSAVPTARQLEYQDWEMGVFFHFGIRSFYEGHDDWDGKPMSPDGFRPAGLNCDNWVVSAKRAGMRYAVFVCKHHDGFANWPSRYSTYSVAQTPWKEGQGDVVREFTEACRRHGIKVGLYYSPAEWGNSKFKDEQAYDEHFLNQIRELLGNYGAIDILWFDGCGSENHQYDWPRIVAEIRRLQPNVLINIGTDRRGLLLDADREALLAFGAEVRRRFGSPLAVMKDGVTTETGWEYAAKEPFYLDHVILQEELSQGEAARRFAIHIQTAVGERLVTIYEGRNVGYKAICRLPLVASRKVVVEFTESERPVKLRNVALHNSTGLVHQH